MGRDAFSCAKVVQLLRLRQLLQTRQCGINTCCPHSGDSFSILDGAACGEWGKRRTESWQRARMSEVFVLLESVLESGDRDFSGLFVRLDGLSTLPRQTITTTVFSLSLRLNLRVLLRESSRPADRTECKDETTGVSHQCFLLGGVRITHNTPRVMHSSWLSREGACTP